MLAQLTSTLDPITRLDPKIILFPDVPVIENLKFEFDLCALQSADTGVAFQKNKKKKQTQNKYVHKEKCLYTLSCYLYELSSHLAYVLYVHHICVNCVFPSTI